MSAYYKPGGVSARVIDIWREEKLTLCVSRAIIEEYRATLARILGVSIDDEIAGIGGDILWCRPPLLPGCVPGDADDEKFLECAVAAKAGYVISGDGHLLAQNGYRGIAVIAPGDFMRELS